MTTKTTRNELTATGLPIIKIRYCHAQTLLKFYEPIAYNAGAYGWNYDVYKINNSLLITGRNMRIKGVDAKYLDEYEKKAQRINNNCLDYEMCETAINELLIEWLEKEMNG